MALHGVVDPSTHVFTHAWCRGIRAAAHYWLSSVQPLNILTYKCCASLPGLIKTSQAITYPAAACFRCSAFLQGNLWQEYPEPPIHMSTAVCLCLGRAHCQLAKAVFKHTSETHTEPRWISPLTRCFRSVL